MLYLGEQPPAEHDDDADVIHSIHQDDGLTQAGQQPPTTAAYNDTVPPPTQAPGMPAGEKLHSYSSNFSEMRTITLDAIVYRQNFSFAFQDTETVYNTCIIYMYYCYFLNPLTIVNVKCSRGDNSKFYILFQ